MQETGHALDARDGKHPFLDECNLLRVIELPAQHQDTVLDIEIDPALGHLRIAEQFRLNMVEEGAFVRRVIGMPVDPPLHSPDDLCCEMPGRPSRTCGGMPDGGKASFRQARPPPVTTFWIEEVHRNRPRHGSEEHSP